MQTVVVLTAYSDCRRLTFGLRIILWIRNCGAVAHTESQWRHTRSAG